MDARIDVFALLGLEQGDAHVIRNAGGVVTDDVIRSLVISQRYLGTTHVVVMHHTDCGMTTFASDGLSRELERETGLRPAWAAEAFGDPMDEIRQSVRRVVASPFVRGTVEGRVWDVETGELRTVVASIESSPSQLEVLGR